jgi:hypothetical protein
MWKYNFLTYKALERKLKIKEEAEYATRNHENGRRSRIKG